MVAVFVDEALIRTAADLALRHGLRGYDAVQLASAISTAARGPMTLATWDRHLSRAAKAEGLSVFPE
ncbi:MAG: type II toxin-antitoxin system VapC family toxin [Chloroflexota bacterium]